MIKTKELMRFVCICVLPFLLISNASAQIAADLLKAAEKGDANAQYSIARSYQLGKRVKSNKKKAIEWYTKAADQGHLEAGYRLGLIYYKGIGGYKIDLKKAYKYISIAANGNHKRSQTHLAKMYERGHGVAKNEMLSDYWIDQAFSTDIEPLDSYLADREDEGEASPDIANDPVVKKTILKQKEAAPVSKKKVVVFEKFPASVLAKSWKENNKPSVYLKSSQTKCKKKGDKIFCTSSKGKGRHQTGIYTYKVRSIITEGASYKDFEIEYRKLYLSVPEESVGGYDDEEEAVSTNRLVTGWEKSSHKLKCKFESSTSVLCRAVGEDAFYIKAR